MKEQTYLLPIHSCFVNFHQKYYFNPQSYQALYNQGTLIKNKIPLPENLYQPVIVDHYIEPHKWFPADELTFLYCEPYLMGFNRSWFRAPLGYVGQCRVYEKNSHIYNIYTAHFRLLNCRLEIVIKKEDHNQKVISKPLFDQIDLYDFLQEQSFCPVWYQRDNDKATIPLYEDIAPLIYHYTDQFFRVIGKLEGFLHGKAYHIKQLFRIS